MVDDPNNSPDWEGETGLDLKECRSYSIDCSVVTGNGEGADGSRSSSIGDSALLVLLPIAEEGQSYGLGLHTLKVNQAGQSEGQLVVGRQTVLNAPEAGESDGGSGRVLVSEEDGEIR